MGIEARTQVDGLLQDRREQDKHLVQGLVDYSFSQVETWQMIQRIAFEAYVAPHEWGYSLSEKSTLTFAFEKGLWVTLPRPGSHSTNAALDHLSAIDLKTGAILQTAITSSKEERTYTLPSLDDSKKLPKILKARLLSLSPTYPLASDSLVLRYAEGNNIDYLDASRTLEKLKALARKKYGTRCLERERQRINEMRSNLGYPKPSRQDLRAT